MTTQITIQNAFDYILSKNPASLITHISKLEAGDYYGTESVHVFVHYIDDQNEEMSNGSDAWIAISDIEDFLEARNNSELHLKNKLASFINKNKILKGRKLVSIESFREITYQGEVSYLVRYNYNTEKQSWLTSENAVVRKSELASFKR
jgi:hypothetical protein